MLIDAGPLVSLIDRREPEHARCLAIFEAARLPLISSWACFTEAMYLLCRAGGFRFQLHLWEFQRRDLLELHASSKAELARIPVLMDRYQNVPMDLADASLVAAAETLGDRTVFTLDNDFRIYRFDDGGAFDVMPS